MFTAVIEWYRAGGVSDEDVKGLIFDNVQLKQFVCVGRDINGSLNRDGSFT